MNRRALKTRETILDTASRLFLQFGINSVGVDTIVAQAGIAKMTLYNHFKSKDELVTEFLEREHMKIISGMEQCLAGTRNLPPANQLLAVFENFEAQIRRPEFRGCAFINSTAELSESDHPGHEVIQRHVATVHRHFLELAVKAGSPQPEILAQSLMFLIHGATASRCMTNNPNVGQMARETARLIIQENLGCRI